MVQFCLHLSELHRLRDLVQFLSRGLVVGGVGWVAGVTAEVAYVGHLVVGELRLFLGLGRHEIALHEVVDLLRLVFVV